MCSDTSEATGSSHRQSPLEDEAKMGFTTSGKEGKLTVKKVSTNNNPADLLAIAMNGEKVMEYTAQMGFDIDSSRANTGPKL